MSTFVATTFDLSTSGSQRHKAAQKKASAIARSKSDARLEARMPTTVLDKVKRAATLEQRTVTDFVVEHLNAAAEQVLLDQTFFSLDEEKFSAFEAMMAAPMSENKAIQNLLSSRSPWDK